MKKFIMFLAVAFVSIAMTSCTIVDSGEVGIEFHKWSSDSQDYGGVEGILHSRSANSTRLSMSMPRMRLCLKWILPLPITSIPIRLATFL